MSRLKITRTGDSTPIEPGDEAVVDNNLAATLTEEAAVLKARQVWCEAEGFERVPGGWTFRVGAGYSSITESGVASLHPQGTRRHAERAMGQG